MSTAVTAPLESQTAQRRLPKQHRSAKYGYTLDELHLHSDIAALFAAHAGDQGAFRKATVERFRLALDEGRAAIRAEFEADGRGLACASALGDLEDALIRAI